MSLEGCNKCCKMLSEHYVKVSLANVEECMDRGGRRLPSMCVTPLSSKYPPMVGKLPKIESRCCAAFPGYHWPALLGSENWTC